MRISDWSSDVCSSDLHPRFGALNSPHRIKQGKALMKYLLLGAAAVALAAGASVAQVDQKPTYGSYGFDSAGMDKSVTPGDDFYDYANGAWTKNTPIPADKSNYGAFNTLDHLSRERTKRSDKRHVGKKW